MRLAGASIALVVGVLLVAGAFMAGDLVELAPAIGVEPEDPIRAVKLVQMGSGGLGVAVLVAGVVAFIKAVRDPRESWAPYVLAMQPMAGEHGRDVEMDPQRGVGFLSFTEGARLEVMVHPSKDGFVNMFMELPGRQRLLFLPMDLDSNEDEADWRFVGQQDGWVCRSDLPSVARPLMRDGSLADALEQLFRHPEVRAVRHDGRGIEVLSDLVEPRQVVSVLRCGLNVCRRLRVLNA